jgi:hypothetical protein
MPLLSLVHFQHTAVSEDDFSRIPSGKSYRGSVLGGRESNRNLVSRLDRTFVPAISVENAGTLRFDTPTYDFSLVVLDVEKNLDMRIGPHEFRHSPRNRNRVNFVVSHIPVVRQQRAAKHQKAHDQGEGCYQFRIHVPPQQIEFATTTYDRLDIPARPARSG